MKQLYRPTRARVQGLIGSRLWQKIVSREKLALQSNEMLELMLNCGIHTSVHGKPVVLNDESLENLEDVLDRKVDNFLRTDWEQYGTQQNAMKAIEDVNEIAKLLYDKSSKKKKIEGPRGPF